MPKPTAAPESASTLPTPLVLAAELWSPATGKDKGLMCEATLPATESTPTPCFATGEALAEAALSSKTPSVVTAPADGDGEVRAAVVMPQFDKDRKASVLILYLGGGDETAAAAELWRGREGSFELSLGEGYHPGLERFARVSQFVCFPRGAGLPGMIWETGLPKIIPDIGTAKGFLRSSGAGQSGLTTGLGLPVVESAELKAVVLLLSSGVSPILHRQSVWKAAVDQDAPDGAPATSLVCTDSASSESGRVGESGVGSTCKLESDASAAQAWDTGRVVMQSLSDDPAGLTCGLAIPVVVAGSVRAVSVLHW